MQPNLSAAPPPFLPIHPISLVRPILPAPPPPPVVTSMRGEASHTVRPFRRAERTVGYRLRQTRNAAAAPYVATPRASSLDVAQWPGYVSSQHIKRALALLEEGEGLQFVPAAHRLHTIAGAFMALTGESLTEVERQCGRIGRALASMGVDQWQIASITVDGIKQCHYRLAHRTITMAQLANHIIQYGTRAITLKLQEVSNPVRFTVVNPVPMPMPAPMLMPELLPTGSSMGSGLPTAVITIAPQRSPRSATPLAQPVGVLPTRYPGGNISLRPVIAPPSTPEPPQQ